MARQRNRERLRVSVTDWIVEDGAERRTALRDLRRRRALRRAQGNAAALRRVGPARTSALRDASRLYSEADIERVLRIRRLVDDLGVNLAGAAAVLHLRQQVIALQREMRCSAGATRPLGGPAARAQLPRRTRQETMHDARHDRHGRPMGRRRARASSPTPWPRTPTW